MNIKIPIGDHLMLENIWRLNDLKFVGMVFELESLNQKYV